MADRNNDNKNASKVGSYAIFIALFSLGFFGLEYLKSGSDDEVTPNAVAKDESAASPSEPAPKPSQELDAPELPEPEKAEPMRVQASSAVCREVTSSSQAFLDQIGESIGVSSNEIEIIGGRHQYASDICNLKIVTPMGVMECNSGPIYTDDEGQSYYTLGTDVGVNNSCTKM